MRAIYEEEGAYVVSMEPCREDAGFKDGSPKRTELFDAGAFNPRKPSCFGAGRHVGVGHRRLDLADEGESPPPLRSARSIGFRVRSPRAARAAQHNSPLHLWNGLDLLIWRPRIYVLLVLVLPALIVSAAAGSVAWWAAVPVFLAAFIAAWIFQYYCFR